MTSSPHDAAHVPEVTRDELAAALAGAVPPALFEVLPRGFWRKHHLPGAVSAPPGEAPAIIAALVPDVAAAIVLYCWDPG